MATGLPMAGNPYRGCTYDLTGKWIVEANDEDGVLRALNDPFTGQPVVIHIDRTDAVLKTQYITGTIFVITAVTGAAAGICARVFLDVNDNQSVIFELAEGFVDRSGRQLYFRNGRADISLVKKHPKDPRPYDSQYLYGGWRKYDGSKVKIAPFNNYGKANRRFRTTGAGYSAVLTPGWAYWLNDESFGVPAVRLSTALFLDDTLPFEAAAFDTTNRFIQAGWFGYLTLGASTINIISPADGKEIFTLRRLPEYNLPIGSGPPAATLSLTGTDQIAALLNAASAALGGASPTVIPQPQPNAVPPPTYNTQGYPPNYAPPPPGYALPPPSYAPPRQEYAPQTYAPAPPALPQNLATAQNSAAIPYPPTQPVAPPPSAQSAVLAQEAEPPRSVPLPATAEKATSAARPQAQQPAARSQQVQARAADREAGPRYVQTQMAAGKMGPGVAAVRAMAKESNNSSSVVFDAKYMRPRIAADDGGVFTGGERLEHLMKTTHVTEENGRALCDADGPRTNGKMDYPTVKKFKVGDLSTRDLRAIELLQSLDTMGEWVDFRLSTLTRNVTQDMRKLLTLPKASMDDLEAFKKKRQPVIQPILQSTTARKAETPSSGQPLFPIINDAQEPIFHRTPFFGLEGGDDERTAPFDFFWRQMAARLRYTEQEADQEIVDLIERRSKPK